jgi:putative oxidoreductase
MRRNLPMMLVRILVGLVFLTEGILKFLQPGELGVGRFTHIGLPVPGILAPIVGIVEIVAGAAVLLSFYAGEAALLLLAVILTAIFTTKIPILLGRPIGHFRVPKGVSRTGLLSFVHEARTDLAMLFCLVATLIDRPPRFNGKRN